MKEPSKSPRKTKRESSANNIFHYAINYIKTLKTSVIENYDEHFLEFFGKAIDEKKLDIGRNTRETALDAAYRLCCRYVSDSQNTCGCSKAIDAATVQRGLLQVKCIGNNLANSEALTALLGAYLDSMITLEADNPHLSIDYLTEKVVKLVGDALRDETTAEYVARYTKDKIPAAASPKAPSCASFESSETLSDDRSSSSASRKRAYSIAESDSSHTSLESSSKRSSAEEGRLASLVAAAELFSSSEIAEAPADTASSRFSRTFTLAPASHAPLMTASSMASSRGVETKVILSTLSFNPLHRASASSLGGRFGSC